MISVPSNLRRRINNDAALAKIARELTGWTVVRPFSGLSSVDEETIRNNYKGSIEDQRFVCTSELSLCFVPRQCTIHVNNTPGFVRQVWSSAFRYPVTVHNCKTPRFQFLRQWKKNNVNGTFQDLAEMFRQARRMDMVEITHRVAGEETEQEEGRTVSSEQNKGATHEAHYSTQFSKLWDNL